MMTLRECYEALVNDLARMPKHLAGTGWHIDRARAYLPQEFREKEEAGDK